MIQESIDDVRAVYYVIKSRRATDRLKAKERYISGRERREENKPGFVVARQPGHVVGEWQLDSGSCFTVFGIDKR